MKASVQFQVPASLKPRKVPGENSKQEADSVSEPVLKLLIRENFLPLTRFQPRCLVTILTELPALLT
jgi:hypothetical protein